MKLAITTSIFASALLALSTIQGCQADREAPSAPERAAHAGGDGSFGETTDRPGKYTQDSAGTSNGGPLNGAPDGNQGMGAGK